LKKVKKKKELKRKLKQEKLHLVVEIVTLEMLLDAVHALIKVIFI